MPSLDQLREKLTSAVPDLRIEVMPNPAVPEQASLRVDRDHALAVARILRDDPELQFDFASNVTGVDWLDRVLQDRVKVKRLVNGVETEAEETVEIKRPGYLEVVYHLYSVALRHGPLVLRMQTENRSDRVRLPSLTPIWRSCELQEREAYDLYGIEFEGHPDLRRLLMWEEFQDFPMRKDYVEPDDFEYEPTPHGAVLERARQSAAARASGGGE